eukprot:gene8056-9466_t
MTRFHSLVLLLVVGCLAAVSNAEYSIFCTAFFDNNKDGTLNNGDTIVETHINLTRPEDPRFVSRDLITPSSSAGASTPIVDGLGVGTYCLTPVIPTIPQGPIIIGALATNNQFDPAKPTYCVTFTPAIKTFSPKLAFRKPYTLTIGGRVWFDKNANNASDFEEPYIIANMNLYKEDKITFVASSQSVLTTGTYKIITVPGNYCLQLVPTDPSYILSYISDTPSPYPADGFYCFTGGLDATVPRFAGFKLAPKYDIQGYTWSDSDNNGVRAAATEPYYGPIMVTLYKTDRVTVVSNVTSPATSAGYKFNVLPGSYCIKMKDEKGQAAPTTIGADSVIKQDGFHCFDVVDKPVTANGGFLQILYDVNGVTWKDLNINGVHETTEPIYGPVNVTLFKADKTSVVKTATSSESGYTFKATGVNIHGVTWADLNGNGVHELTEGAYAPVLVSLLKVVVVNTAVTPATDGSYSFNSIQSGDYCIKMTPEKFSKNTILGVDNKIPVEGFHCFTVTNKDVIVKGGYIELAYTVQGVTFLDKDRNGLLNSTDPYYGPIIVTLYQSDKTTVVDKTSSPSTDVGYTFKSLHPGHHFVPGRYCINSNNPTSTETIEVPQICHLDPNNSGKQFCFDINDSNTNDIIVDFN